MSNKHKQTIKNIKLRLCLANCIINDLNIFQRLSRQDHKRDEEGEKLTYAGARLWCWCRLGIDCHMAGRRYRCDRNSEKKRTKSHHVS